MKNLKKVLALVIAFTMVLGFGVSASVFPDVADDASYAEAVTILSAMGIMVGDDNGNFRPDDTITRAEAAAIVVRAKGLDDAAEGAKGATSFSDVAADHWATGYINLASQSGIVNGFTDGTFRPEEPVAYEQMVKMIVSALGFEPKATLLGGYPTGYLVIAAQEKINAGATGSAGEPAKRSVDARLIFNALTVKMMEVDEYGTEVTYKQKDKTLLKDYLDTHVIEGVVKSAPLDDGADAEDDEVKFTTKSFDGTTDTSKWEFDPATKYIYEDKVAVSELVGQTVTAYITEDEDGEWPIIAIAPKTGKNQAIALDYSQLEGFSSPIVKYTEEGASAIEEIELATSPKLFWNGRSTTAGDAKVNAFLAQGTVIPGKVEFLDNNNDDLYDFVFVTEYGADYVVKSVGEYKLTDKTDSTIPKIDMRDENRIVRIYKDGEVIDFADIAAGDVVTVACSTDDKLVNVYVSSNKVTGAVTEVSTDTDAYYTIGDAQYRKTASASVKRGDEGVFYLNVDNRIVGKDASASEIGNYAFMYTAFAKKALGGTVVEVKFINAKGEWITADVYKYAKVYKTVSSEYVGVKPDDGNALTTDDTSASDNVNMGIYSVASGVATANNVLFKYTTNSDGEINNIYLDAGVANSEDFSKDETSGAVKKTYNATDLNLGATYFQADTTVFSIPDGAVTKEEDINVTTVGAMLKDKTDYKYDAYDLTEEGYPTVVVIKGETTAIDPATRLLVIDSITTTTNADDNDVKKITGYQGGQLVSALTSATATVASYTEIDTTVIDTVDELKVGDAILFSVNGKGEIDKIKVLITYEDAKARVAANKAGTANGKIAVIDATEGEYDVTTLFGFAAQKSSGNRLAITDQYINNVNNVKANLVDADRGTPIMHRANAAANFYEINVDRTKVATAVSSYADLEVELANSTAQYNYYGAWVYVRMINNVVTDVIVYTSANPLAA